MKTKHILILVGVLLLAGLIIGGIVWYNKSQKKSDDAEKNKIIDQILANHPNSDVTRETLLKKTVDELKALVPASVH